MKIKALVLLMFAVSLSACSHKYRVDNLDVPDEKIDFSSSFYVSQPENGKFENADYVNSGQQTVQAIELALTKMGASVTTANTIESKNDALLSARDNNSQYLFFPQILHWEDRATEWSSRPDRITMLYAIFDTYTKEKLTSMTISASSKWATFGGDHPQDLVPQTVQDFVNAVR